MEQNNKTSYFSILTLVTLSLFILIAPAHSASIEDAKRLIRIKDFTGAHHILLKLAKKNNIDAQYTIATLYRNGHGINKDLDKSFYWFKSAARKHHIKAQYELGLLYRDGHGTGKDLNKAIFWLSKAAEKNHRKAASLLKTINSQDINLDQKSDAFSLAQQAIVRGDNTKLPIILGHIQINRTDSYGNSLLHTAAKYRNEKSIKLLLKNNINQNIINHNSETALLVAAGEDFQQVFKLLITKGNINHKNKQGSTALIRASKRDNIKLVKLLLDKGAQVNIKDKYGLQAVDYAQQRNYKNIQSILLASGAILKTNKERRPTLASVQKTGFYKGWTSLMIASWKSDLQHCISILKKNHSSVNKQDPQGFTALMRASMKGHIEVSNLLIKNKANINIANHNGESALFLAASNGHEKVVSLLATNLAYVEH